MTTVQQVISAAIPNADAEMVEHIMWARTPFPAGSVTARGIYKAASTWHRASKSGVQLCDFCNRAAIPEKWTCRQCWNALHSGRAA